MQTIDGIKKDYQSAPVSEKLKALLSIAGSVQKGGKNVTAEQIKTARALGATDKEIHETVLIAAAFCMFNRYVDGLGTWAPSDRQLYVDRAKWRADEGYADIDLYK
jgi:alkylhydroperoxidase family enzyme